MEEPIVVTKPLLFFIFASCIISAVAATTFEICSETRCRADHANLGESLPRSLFLPAGIYSVYDACWTMDISDPANCDEGYEARTIEDVDVYSASTNNDLTYFTCCKSGHKEEIKNHNVRRQCNSKACSGDLIKCVATYAENTLQTIEESNNFCDNDDNDVYKYPNIVANDDEMYLTYNCCRTDDGSFENYVSGCSSSPCANHEKACIAGLNYFGSLFPRAFQDCSKFDERYKYRRKMDFDNGEGVIFYSCCETDDGSLSPPYVSPGGYIRDNTFYLNSIPQLLLSSMTVLAISVLLTSILSRKETRSEVYNVYIIFLLIPDLFMNLFLVVVLSMQLLDLSASVLSFTGMYEALSNASIIVNIWINNLVAYEILTLASRSRQCLRIQPPTLKKVLFQCLPLYIIIIVGSSTFSKFRSEDRISEVVYSVTTWTLIVFNAIIPCLYLIYVFCKVMKSGMISIANERTRGITIYFTRIIIVFFAFMFPYGVLHILNQATWMKYRWISTVMRYLVTIQGLVSTIFSFMKTDISKSLTNLFPSSSINSPWNFSSFRTSRIRGSSVTSSFPLDNKGNHQIDNTSDNDNHDDNASGDDSVSSVDRER